MAAGDDGIHEEARVRTLAFGRPWCWSVGGDG
jgi:hypothetical protein